jgi:hypothetical protein
MAFSCYPFRGPIRSIARISSYTHPFSHHRVTLQVFINLNLNGIVVASLVCQFIEPNSSIIARSPQSCTSMFVTAQGKLLYVSATQLFQLPSGITMSIAATRMYRSLSDFVSSTTEMYDILSIFSSHVRMTRWLCSAYDDPPKCDSKVSELKWNQSAPIAFNQIEVTVDTGHEQSQRSWVSRHDLYKSKEEQSCDLDKPHRDGCEP